jgi:hypothetical protein
MTAGRRRDLKAGRGPTDISGMKGHASGYRDGMRTRDDDDGLRSEVGQTLVLFGMGLAVVLVGLLAGLGL